MIKNRKKLGAREGSYLLTGDFLDAIDKRLSKLMTTPKP
jgi:hypothetical protein